MLIGNLRMCNCEFWQQLLSSSSSIEYQFEPQLETGFAQGSMAMHL
jgi:hypothetical protein